MRKRDFSLRGRLRAWSRARLIDRLRGVIRPPRAVWLPLDGGSDRVRLAALADAPKPPETLDRAERGHRGWYYRQTRERQ